MNPLNNPLSGVGMIGSALGIGKKKKARSTADYDAPPPSNRGAGSRPPMLGGGG